MHQTVISQTQMVSEDRAGDAFPWGAWPRDAALDTRK